MEEWVQSWREIDSEYEEMEGLILKTGIFREGFMEEAAFALSPERLRRIFID